MALLLALAASFLAVQFLALLPGILCSPCHSGKTCGSCIQLSPECAWCADRNYHVTNHERCDSLKQLQLDSCLEIVNPSGNIEYTKNEAVRNGDRQTPAVQLQPQAVKLRLRPNQPQSFQLTFRLAENYPVDLYYLMDLSSSMRDDKKNIESLAIQIGSSMRNITQNFRLGFGSFVEKVISPFVAFDSNGSPFVGDGLIAPYSFKHQLALNADAELFKESVSGAKLAANADSPESGLDAMIQAVVCKDQIGWRDTSRKLLLYASDASFKMAGDGKLAGIMKPNDGHCHLDSDGHYTESLNQDYPSVGQVAEMVRDNNINCIFAVPSYKRDLYNTFSDMVSGSVTTVLARGSSNIVQIIQENYKRITSKLQLITQAPEYVQVKFTSSCSTGGSPTETTMCENLKIGQSVTFTVSVSLSVCPADALTGSHTFSIYPVGLSEKLDVTLDLICDCDCRQSGEPVPVEQCQGNGTLECGLCVCPKGRYGPLCECEGSALVDSTQNCTDSSSPGQVPCSGRGKCVCGTCQCFPIGSNRALRYTGQFCQCDDSACSLGAEVACHGHGQCDCGTCKCDAGFSGSHCDCPTTKDKCLTVAGKVCNGEGLCECNACTCFANSSYVGAKCEQCPTCPGKCGEHRNCVMCRAFSSGSIRGAECDLTCPNVTMVDSIDRQEVKRQEKVSLCEGLDEDDCTFLYTYEVNEKQEVLLRVQKTKACPEPVNAVTVIMGAIGGILALGILLLIVAKLAIVLMNRIEYARFEKEAQQADWGTHENPLYNPAESHFTNPAFVKNE